MALVMFDLETTGVETDQDRIVEIALCAEDGSTMPAILLHTLVNPGRPIPPEATEVHGITDEMVREAPFFKDVAADVQGHLVEATLVGYSSRAFDTLILDRELRDAGQPGIDLESVAEIDLCRVWKEVEPRTLEGAIRRYLEEAMEVGKAHRARRDAAVLGELMLAMQEVHDLTLEHMIALSRPHDEVDRSGKLRRLEDGTVVFAFGKWEGRPVLEHRDYIRWMLEEADFPADTCRALRHLLEVTRV